MHKVKFELNKKSPQPGKVEGIGFMLFIKSGQLELSYTPGHPTIFWLSSAKTLLCETFSLLSNTKILLCDIFIKMKNIIKLFL